MGLSRLAAKCRACPHVSTCNHKRMEALGYLPLPKPTIEIQVDRTAQFGNMFDYMSRLLQIPKQYLRGDDR